MLLENQNCDQPCWLDITDITMFQIKKVWLQKNV